ncbi:MAG: membrane protein insertion efficiency factor YidD [Syntrophales bacterium]
MSDRPIRNLLAKVFILAIRFYQKAISPFLAPSCRFHPSCSDYALTAIERYGPYRGVWLGLKRLARCHPFHPGGFDPVR